MSLKGMNKVEAVVKGVESRLAEEKKRKEERQNETMTIKIIPKSNHRKADFFFIIT